MGCFSDLENEMNRTGPGHWKIILQQAQNDAKEWKDMKCYINALFKMQQREDKV